QPSINTKYVQLLKDMAPQMTRVAVIQAGSSWRGDFAVIEAVARPLGVTPVARIVRDDPADIGRVMETFAAEPNSGLIFPPDNAANKHRRLIATLAAKHRLPAIYSNRLTVDVGGLMSYSAAPIDFRQVASYVDRILRGAKPSDLPVQLPTKFNLA